MLLSQIDQYDIVQILVKMILAFMIQDKQDCVRIKREQIEIHSLQKVLSSSWEWSDLV